MSDITTNYGSVSPQPAGYDGSDGGISGVGGASASGSLGGSGNYGDLSFLGLGSVSRSLRGVDKTIAGLGKPVFLDPDQIYAEQNAALNFFFRTMQQQQQIQGKAESLFSRQAMKAAFDSGKETIKAAEHSLRGAAIKMGMAVAGGGLSLVVGGLQARSGSKAVTEGAPNRELSGLKQGADDARATANTQLRVLEGAPAAERDQHMAEFNRLDDRAYDLQDQYEARALAVARERGVSAQFRGEDGVFNHHSFHSSLGSHEQRLNNQAMAIGGVNNATSTAVSSAGDIGSASEDLDAKRRQVEASQLDAVKDNLQSLSRSQGEGMSRALEGQQAVLSNLQQIGNNISETKV